MPSLLSCSGLDVVFLDTMSKNIICMLVYLYFTCIFMMIFFQCRQLCRRQHLGAAYSQTFPTLLQCSLDQGTAQVSRMFGIKSTVMFLFAS